MHLADEITIELGAECIALRPTLRAAYRLERAWGGFDKLIDAVKSGSVTAMSAIICASAPQSAYATFLADCDVTPFRLNFARLAGPLIAHIYALAGFDFKAPADADDANAPAMTYGELHTKLFRIGTGWLGWTPEETWNAAPAEIIEAKRGRQEMLQAIFGGGEPEKPKLSLDEQIRLTMAEVIARKRAEKAAA